MPTRQIVVACGSIIRNDWQQGEPLPAGYDRYSGLQFGNRDFVTNAVLYLADDEGLINLRQKEIALRLINTKSAYEHKAGIQAATVGELGWITPFRYVYPFENAVYTTPVGEVTPVFRSAYGFHIALVEEEIDHEEVNAAHIMKMVPRGDSVADIAAKRAIDSLYAVVKGGADFATVAQTESDDALLR